MNISILKSLSDGKLTRGHFAAISLVLFGLFLGASLVSKSLLNPVRLSRSESGAVLNGNNSDVSQDESDRENPFPQKPQGVSPHQPTKAVPIEFANGTQLDSTARARMDSSGLEPDSPVTAHDGSLAPKRAMASTSRFMALVSSGQQLLQQVSANLLTLSRVEIDGNYRLSRAQIMKLAGLDARPWIWQTSPEDIEIRLRGNPWIEKVECRFLPSPARIALHIVEAEPWLIAEYQKHSWLVSHEGILLQTLDTLKSADTIVESTELPRVDGLETQTEVPTYLSSPNARFSYAMRLIKLFESAGEFPFQVDRYSLLSNGSLLLRAETSQQIPQILLTAENFHDALNAHQRLRAVLSDLHGKGERPQKIDLRFKNQAIVE